MAVLTALRGWLCMYLEDGTLQLSLGLVRSRPGGVHRASRVGGALCGGMVGPPSSPSVGAPSAPGTSETAECLRGGGSQGAPSHPPGRESREAPVRSVVVRSVVGRSVVVRSSRSGPLRCPPAARALLARAQRAMRSAGNALSGQCAQRAMRSASNALSGRALSWRALS